MHHRLFVLLLASTFAIGCPPVRGDDDDTSDCDPDTDAGTLRACVSWDQEGDPLVGATVSVRESPEHTPIEALTGDDGCADIELEAGSWEVSASNPAGDCVTPYDPHEIEGCEVLESSFYVGEWCMDGR